jgi:hypothetical protein
MQTLEYYLSLGKRDIQRCGYWYGEVFVPEILLHASSDPELMLSALVELVREQDSSLEILKNSKHQQNLLYLPEHVLDWIENKVNTYK